MQLAFVACRLFALYLFAQVAVWCIYLLNPFELPATLTSAHYSIAASVPLASAIMGCICWFGAGKLSRIIAKGNSLELENTGLYELQTTGFSILGMYWLTSNAPSLLLHVTHASEAYPVESFTRSSLYAVMGVALIYKASWLAKKFL